MAEGTFGPEEVWGNVHSYAGVRVFGCTWRIVQALIGTEADEHFGVPWNAKVLPRHSGWHRFRGC